MRAHPLRPRWALFGLTLALLVAATAIVLTRAGNDREPELLTWFDQTASAVREQRVPDAAASRTWALAWWAADRALSHAASEPTYATAAVASAVHDVLVATVPARSAVLDASLRRSLDRAGNDRAASEGATAGREQAAAVLAERADDGLTADALEGPFTPPPESPGVWRPTPPGFAPAVEVRQLLARPFALTSPGQLRPGAPPAVGSTTDLRDLAEARDLGAAQGSRRTTEQTQVARFWELSQVEAFTRLIRPELVARGTSLAEGAHLLSVLHRAAADAEISVFDAKYAYLHWRPVTALTVGVPRAAATTASSGGASDGGAASGGGADDGVPRDRKGDGGAARAAEGVPAVPGWTPLIVTPAHPEYPSAHTVYAGAVVTVLSTLFDGEPQGLGAVTSAGAPGVTRSFTTWAGLLRENEDARVYGGIHFRTSDEVGTELGRSVAEVALAHG